MLRCLCLYLLFLTSPTPAVKQTPVAAPGVPVIIKTDTLFTLYATQRFFTPKERAAIVEKRINGVISRIDFNADSIVLKNDSAVSVISYKSEIILALNNADASFSELDRPHLAESYLTILRKKLGTDYKSNSLKEIFINVLEALAVLAVLMILILAVNRGFLWLKGRVLTTWDIRIAKLGEQGAPITYANRLLPLVTGLVNLARLIVIFILVYLALPLVFFIFPWTKPVATQLLSYVINPLEDIFMAIVHYIPKLLTVIVIYLVTRYVVRFVKFIAGEIETGGITIKGFYPDWSVPTYNIIRVLLYAFMFVVVFPYLPGSDSKIFQGVTVFLGVLVSFGSSSAISSMIAGLVLTYMRPFKIGDRVKVGEITGDVIEKNLLITRIRTIKHEDITLPNATILGGATTNFSSSAQKLGLILHTDITIGYDAPWRTVHELMINAALDTEGILKDPKPFVLQTDLNDFNVTYQINAYTKHSKKMSALYSALHQNIQDKFNEAGMEIMSPNFTALRDGNAIQIPDDSKPDGYKRPGFKVEK